MDSVHGVRMINGQDEPGPFTLGSKAGDVIKSHQRVMG